MIAPLKSVQNKSKLSPAARQELGAIIALAQQGVTRLYAAGQRLCHLVESVPGVIELISKDHPELRPTLYGLQRIGRRTLAPQLLLLSGAGFRYLSDMELETQNIYLKKPVQLLVPGGVKETPVSTLTDIEARQVFDQQKKQVRGLKEQRIWVEMQQRAVKVQATRLWRIHRHTREVIIARSGRLPLKEVKALVRAALTSTEIAQLL